MKTIEYKATIARDARGDHIVEYEYVHVDARDITSGFLKAARAARAITGPSDELHAIEFLQVIG